MAPPTIGLAIVSGTTNHSTADRVICVGLGDIEVSRTGPRFTFGNPGQR